MSGRPGDYLECLEARHAYLQVRIQAKESVGWETVYDERERAALEWALHRLTSGVDLSGALQGDDDGA